MFEIWIGIAAGLVVILRTIAIEISFVKIRESRGYDVFIMHIIIIHVFIPLTQVFFMIYVI